MGKTSVLGNVAVKLGLISEEFNRNISAAEVKFKRFGQTMTKIGNTISGSVTLPLVLGAGKSIALFDKQAKAIAQVEQGLRSTGNAAGLSSKQLQDMASNLQGITIFGDEDILANVTSQLLSFTNISGEAFERTQKAALDLATRLDGDLKSASIQLGKALNDPVANLSALSRSGIQFSASQKAVINDFANTNRLADAQAIILDELEKQYGGSAEAARKAGVGGLQALNNSFGDILERVGGALIPVLNRLVEFFDGVVAKANKLTDAQIRLGVAVGIAVAAVGPMITVVGLLSKAFLALATPLALKIAAVAALAAGINYLYQNAGQLAERFVYAFDVAKNAVLSMTADAIDSLSFLIGVFDKAGGISMKAMAIGIRSGIGDVKKDFTDFKGFTETLTDSLGSLAKAFDDIFVKMSGGLPTPKATVRPIFGDVISRGSIDYVSDLGSTNALTGNLSNTSETPNGLERFAELSNFQIAQAQAIGQAFDAVADSFARAFVDSITDMKNFSDVFKGVGISIVNTLKEVAAQLIKMAGLQAIASSFGLGGITTAVDLGAKLFGKLTGKNSVGSFIPGVSQNLNANLFINGRKLATENNYSNFRGSQFGF